MYRSVAIFRKLDDVAEDLVGWPVGTTPLPPALDNSMVVPIKDDMITFI